MTYILVSVGKRRVVRKFAWEGDALEAYDRACKRNNGRDLRLYYDGPPGWQLFYQNKKDGSLRYYRNVAESKKKKGSKPAPFGL